MNHRARARTRAETRAKARAKARARASLVESWRGQASPIPALLEWLQFALLNHGEDKPAQSLHFWSCYNFSYDAVPWIMSVVHYGASHTCDGRSRILIVSTQSCCDRAPYLSGSLAQVAFATLARCQRRGAQPRKRRRCRDCGRLISPGCAAGCCRINGGSEAGWCWCVDCPEARPAPPVEPEPEPCRERSRNRSRSRSRIHL